MRVHDFCQFLHINNKKVQYSSDCWLFIISWFFSWRPHLKVFFFWHLEKSSDNNTNVGGGLLSHLFIWMVPCRKNGKHKKCASQHWENYRFSQSQKLGASSQYHLGKTKTSAILRLPGKSTVLSAVWFHCSKKTHMECVFCKKGSDNKWLIWRGSEQHLPM